MVNQMNCVRPVVSAEDEFFHRVRNWNVLDIARIQSFPSGANLAALDDYERGVAECWRDVQAEKAPNQETQPTG